VDDSEQQQVLHSGRGKGFPVVSSRGKLLRYSWHVIITTSLIELHNFKAKA